MGWFSACCLVSLAVFCLLDRVDGGSKLESLEYQTLHLDTPSAAGLRKTSSKRTEFTGERTVSKSLDGNTNGLVTSVWHRYSPDSPFLPENATHQSLLKQSLLRDTQRLDMFTRRIRLAAHNLRLSDLNVPQNVEPMEAQASATTSKSSPSDLVSPVVSGLSLGSGEYFARIEVGTPGASMYLVMDTGSDILWLQCTPCENCYNQHDPVFNPKNSSSYGAVPCSDEACKNLEISECYKNRCLYQASYGDGSFTVGDLAKETFTFDSPKGGPKVVKNVAFGCGHDNQGLFVGAAGIMGLSKGALAFPNQVGDSYSKKFSYCLVSRDAGNASPSSLIFGDAAVPSAPFRAMFTPQVFNEKIPSFYYVGLTGISVGGRLLGIPVMTFELETTGKGGVIIDSGTAITWLKKEAYVVVRDAFRAGASHLPFSSATFEVFDTCYNLSNYTAVDVPTVTMHFQGVDLKLPASNYMISVDEGGSYCLALAQSSSNFTIIGNVQQQNFRVVYDNENYRIGFFPEQCA